MHTLNHAHKMKDDQSAMDITPVVDYKVTMLIAAGAAMAANCEPCLNKVVPDLMEAGVAEDDIRRAVEIGQFEADLGLLARFVGFAGRGHVDGENPFLGRDDDLLCLGVNLAAGDGDCLDEEVGHVLLDYRDLVDGALAV